MSELGNRDVAGMFLLQCISETDLRSERVVVTGRPQRFPAVGSFSSTADTVLESDLIVVFEQCWIQRIEFLNEGPFAFHIPMPGQDAELDFAAFLIGPFF